MPFILKTKINSDAALGIWQITETEELLQSLIRISEEDAIRLQDIRHPLRRRQWLACRIMICDLTSDPRAQVHYTAEGKPVLASGSHQISLSHSGEFAAVLASSESPVGIDIELLRNRITRVADRFMTPEELGRTADPGWPEKLYIHWCAKEAVYKLYGGQILDMQQEIVLEPFDYLCTESGKVKAVVSHGQRRLTHELTWFRTTGWMMAYTFGPGETK